MAKSQTGPKFEQPTFNCNIFSNFTHRASELNLNHSQEPCEWVDPDFWVPGPESKQKLHLKSDCSNFGPFQELTVYLPYLRWQSSINGRISDRDEIWTPNFQLQYLLQFYSKNLTIVLEPFTGTMWMG